MITCIALIAVVTLAILLKSTNDELREQKAINALLNGKCEMLEIGISVLTEEGRKESK